ncbi:MAG: DUF2812 domain-containing protein [Clostridia bacterium]|nr:DUF2812 domain-containing protein [Clostridia bacterium]
MEKTVFKLFYSKYNEEKWLCSLGEQGYLLTKIRDSKYYFETEEDKRYYYSTLNLDVSCKSEQADEFFKQLEPLGIRPAVTSGQWAYLVSEDKDALDSLSINASKYKNNPRPYIIRALYFLFFALVFCLVTGYQIHAVHYLGSVGYETPDHALIVIAVTAPIAAICSAFGAINLEVFFSTRKGLKILDPNHNSEVEDDAETTAEKEEAC